MGNRLGKGFLGVLLSLILLLSSTPALAGDPNDRQGMFPPVPGGLDDNPYEPPDKGEPPADEGDGKQQTPTGVYEVTLITGDTVTVTVGDNGTKSFSITPADPTRLGQSFLTEEENGNTYIFPEGIDPSKLDKELFNIDYLVDEQYYLEPSLPLLVSYSSGLPDMSVQSLQSEIQAVGEATKLLKNAGAIATRLDYQNISPAYESLASSLQVAKIWLDKKYHVQLSESVPLIGAPSYWASGYNGTGIKIAILDTGIDASHPGLDDLDDNPATNDPKVTVNVNFTDDAGTADLYGHGTHVAGIAAGTAAGSNYTGVAPGAWLWNVKVLNSYGYGYTSWIINGVDFASLGPDGMPRTGDEADIINMSLGGGGKDGTDPMSQAVNQAVDRGVVVVIAAGNSGSGMSTIGSPGVASKPITVGASDKYDVLAYFSSRGPTLDGRIKPDILAPGVDIMSTVTTNPAAQINDPSGYRKLNGTSMATPHVAGAAALLLQRYGGSATPQFVKDTLMSTSKDLGYNVYEQGAGRLNLAPALLPGVGVTPASLSLGMFTSANTTASGNFTFYNNDEVSHTVSLSASLTDVFTGNDYTPGSPQMQWQKTFGGTDNDGIRSVVPTTDGGYIIAGYTYSFGAGGSDVYLVKTDASGNLTWQRTFGGTSSDYGYPVRQTTDGGYIIAGYTYSFGAGGSDVYLVKTDASGNLSWQQTFGGTNSDYGLSISQTADGGYIIGGITYSFGAGNSDVYLIKTDVSGNMTWQKTFGGTNYDYGWSVQQTADGGYIIGGYTDSFGAGNSDVYLVKTDTSGNLTWQKTFGGSNWDYGFSAQPTADGGYIIGGETYSFGAGGYDIYLVKTDSAGNITWQKTFGGTNSDYGYAVQQTTDGGYILGGYTYSFGAGNADAYLVKVKIASTGVTTLTPASFTIPPGGQVEVNLSVNLTALPNSLYSGKLLATVDNTTSIHAIFGFSKLNKVTVRKTDINGLPAQGHGITVLRQDPVVDMPGLTTNQSGEVTVYLMDGNYDLLSYSAANQTSIWTVAENVTVASDTAINLDERDTKVVDFNPNKPGLKAAAKASTIYYWNSRYGIGWRSAWWYPQNFAARVSPISKFDAGFTYQAYPAQDFDSGNPSLVNTTEWLNLLYSVDALTDNTTFIADYPNLAHRDTAYGVALNGERAYLSQYLSDDISWWSSPSFSFRIDAPQQRWEWLSPSPARYGQNYRRYQSANGNMWEFYSYYSMDYPPGNASANIGFHPFTSGFDYVYLRGNNEVHFWGNVSRDSTGYSRFNSWDTSNSSYRPGYLKVTQNSDNVVLEKEISSYFNEIAPISGTVNMSIELWEKTQLALSSTTYTRLDFIADPTRWDIRPPRLDSITVPGVNASGIVPSGQVKVDVKAYDDSPVIAVSLQYSLTDNGTWLDAGAPTGAYTFSIGGAQNTFVNLAIDATDQWGNHIRREISRAFYVAGTPHITVNPSSLELTLAPGENVIRTLTIGNTGNGTLTYIITDNLTGPPFWLTENPKIGTVQPGASANIDVIVNAANLTQGNYSASIFITHNDAQAPNPWIVPVNLMVSQTTVSILAPDKVVPGSNFTAKVEISQVENLDAVNYDVSFNPAVLRLFSITPGSVGSGGNWTAIPVDAVNATANGTFTIVQNVPGLGGVSGSGSLAILHFQAIGPFGSSSDIALSNGTLSSNLAEEITAAWIGDSVLLTGIAGDATGDGRVNALDITKVERIIAGLDEPTAGADANQDGNINALDITKVERIIAKLD